MTTNTNQSQHPQKTESKLNRSLMIGISVMLCLAITGYAMTVESFNDYNPPDYLYINWGDWFRERPDGVVDSPTVNNSISEFPNWSAEYPYRAIFLGGTPSKVIDYYVVYSKVPSTSLFTFEYISGNKSTYQIGRIRAYIPSNKVGRSEGRDFAVVRIGHDNTGTYSIPSYAQQTRFDVSGSGVGTSGSNVYFSFDFFYDCASEHQQNAGDLNISGVTSISGVPYKYVTHCLDHHGYTGGGSGGGESSGGGGTGSNGQRWGNGKYGGGIDWGSGGSPTINGGGGYSSSRSDWNYDSHGKNEYSSTDDWKQPYEGGSGKSYSWENDANTPNFNFKIPTPPYTGQGDGDTGKDGSTITFPVANPSPPKIFEINTPKFPLNDKLTVVEFPTHLYFTDGWPPKLIQ